MKAIRYALLLFVVTHIISCRSSLPEELTPMIATLKDPSLVMIISDDEFKDSLPKAQHGNLYAIDKVIGYYLQHENDKEAERWIERRERLEKTSQKN